MSNAATLIVVAAPLLIALVMAGNCAALKQTREQCDPDAQVPQLVQSVVTTVFAWMATPPR